MRFRPADRADRRAAKQTQARPLTVSSLRWRYGPPVTRSWASADLRQGEVAPAPRRRLRELLRQVGAPPASGRLQWPVTSHPRGGGRTVGNTEAATHTPRRKKPAMPTSSRSTSIRNTATDDEPTHQSIYQVNVTDPISVEPDTRDRDDTNPRKPRNHWR